ncbi:MAG TPA: LCP family protein [Dictyobacter sp.]|nr:LCP family protein [Dictyobacter sp.]
MKNQFLPFNQGNKPANANHGSGVVPPSPPQYNPLDNGQGKNWEAPEPVQNNVPGNSHWNAPSHQGNSQQPLRLSAQPPYGPPTYDPNATVAGPSSGMYPAGQMGSGIYPPPQPGSGIYPPPPGPQSYAGMKGSGTYSPYGGPPPGYPGGPQNAGMPPNSQYGPGPSRPLQPQYPGALAAHNYGAQGPRPPLKSPKKRRIPIWARVVIGIVVFMMVGGGVAFAYYQINFASSVNNITGQTAIRKNGNSNLSNVDPLTQRTNILLLGSDTDGKNNDPTAQGEAPLAQTVIILTIDPTTHYVGMLSIPRDTQVYDPIYDNISTIPKLDETFSHAWGPSNASEADKARAAAGHIEDVIQQNYGIQINHYAWVGLQGFMKVIDTVGGVDVDLAHPMLDDNYPNDTTSGDQVTAANQSYDYKDLYLTPGPQHLDGLTALEYVRTRHSDLNGDFGRTERQQQVLTAVKVKLQSTNTINEAPQLLKDMNGYMMTDLTVTQLAQLAQVSQNVDVNKVQRLTLPTDTTPIGNTTNYAPDCSEVVPDLNTMFSIQANCIPQDAYGSELSQTITSHTPVSQATNPASSTSIDATASAGQLSSSLATTAQSSVVTPTDLNNLYDLMLLAVSGSFNTMTN